MADSKHFAHLSPFRQVAAQSGSLALLAACLSLPAQAQSSLPSRPSQPCAGGICANGGFQNNGWGNGYQSAPGNSGLTNNAANTTKVNKGIATASQNSNGQITGTGQALTPGTNPVTTTTTTVNGQTSPTPSRSSNGVANTPAAQGSFSTTTAQSGKPAVPVNAPMRSAGGFLRAPSR